MLLVSELTNGVPPLASTHDADWRSLALPAERSLALPAEKNGRLYQNAEDAASKTVLCTAFETWARRNAALCTIARLLSRLCAEESAPVYHIYALHA